MDSDNTLVNKFYPFQYLLPQVRSDTVDLTDTSLLVDISDALSEREKVKFTVHTKVNGGLCIPVFVFMVLYLYLSDQRGFFRVIFTIKCN